MRESRGKKLARYEVCQKYATTTTVKCLKKKLKSAVVVAMLFITHTQFIILSVFN